jgi:hypothetical protein
VKLRLGERISGMETHSRCLDIALIEEISMDIFTVVVGIVSVGLAAGTFILTALSFHRGRSNVSDAAQKEKHDHWDGDGI